MKYKILSKTKITEKFTTEKLIDLLLKNRGIQTKKEKELFLNPKLSDVTIQSVGIDIKEVEKAKKRINAAIKNKEAIVVFGDYDVDGICGTAILWETLNMAGANVLPYIPHRVDEGYGLSIKGISNVKSQMPKVKLIITVDNGVVANKAVEFAKAQGIEVIITDHHTFGKVHPKSFAIIHTKRLCGASVAWLFSKAMGSKDQSHIELCAIATIADLVPLVGLNRTVAKLGIEKLKTTKRIGILELVEEAALDLSKITSFEIGHIIAPRINAMGRIEYAMDSLRLLCTKNKARAKELSKAISETNRKRQTLTLETTTEIIGKVKKAIGNKKLVFVSDEKYNQGIIGLVAGKLVEEFYLPSIVVSKGETVCKASARSIKGFNIVDFIRCSSDLLVDVGGHPMAAGFTVETNKLLLLQSKLEKLAQKMVLPNLLKKEIIVDCEIPLTLIDLKFVKELEKLAPFGPSNTTPTFLTKGLTVEDIKLVGVDKRHLRLVLIDQKTGTRSYSIGFGLSEKAKNIRIGDKVNVIYTLSVDEWNGNQRIQMKIKDLFKST
ncbi:MAG: single-stranded-DNA-specific exonuclease RecJ [Candidatus Levybacteria bacterium RBG_16_35_11]|nr:MAG: single-stranded-DNA-specific exonuclease RecJ [Candidatus Levybacteria bacterium RBG_16_35_11]